jgi:hypothetical protein
MSRRAAVIIIAALVACSAGAFVLSRVAGAEEQVTPTMTEILQARVSVKVENATAVQLWDAVFKASGDAAVKLGASSFKASPGIAPEYIPTINKDWRVTLTVNNIRVGDLLRLVAAVYGCDVYVKGQREIALVPPETREQQGVVTIPPLSANDY